MATKLLESDLRQFWMSNGAALCQRVAAVMLSLRFASINSSNYPNYFQKGQLRLKKSGSKEAAGSSDGRSMNL